MKTRLLLAMVILAACSGKKKVDAIYHHGTVYTVDSTFSVAEAFAVKDGRIVAVGSNPELLTSYEANETVDLQGKPVYPGFIDAHCHFYYYGLNIQQANLIGTMSFREVANKLVEHAKTQKEGWLEGRGWDQNDWEVKEFPDRTSLDSLFPDRPVVIKRVDGHAVLANGKALELAGITVDTKVSGGAIGTAKGKTTGILVDNAMELVYKVMPKTNVQLATQALITAQQNCFAAGLTTVDDAGLEKETVQLIDSLQQRKELKMRIYAMLTPSKENKDHFFAKGPLRTERLSACSFKVYADGALGSRGACLLAPYSDRPKEQGFLLHSIGYFDSLAAALYKYGFQMNTHCIGDSSNRHILNLYGAVLKGKNDKRWRIEHAQVVNKADFTKFKQFDIIPSVQPTHATSDMYWVKDRLGEERVKGAYAYQQLCEDAGLVANGSDFPVEDINPLYGFYAAVVRKDQKGFPANRFQPESKLSREQALRGMTIWAAYSNFEEKQKGSIEVGKVADFVILDDDLLKASDNNLFKIKVLKTYLSGEKVYDSAK